MIHIISTYGYIGIFGLLMFGIIGVPVPDEILLIFTGYQVFKGTLSPVPALAAAFLGSAAGISLSYALGKYLGHPLIRNFGGKLGISEETLGHSRAWLDRYGKWTLLIGYFIPGMRHFTALTAGASDLRLRIFMPFAYAGALLWSSTFIVAGYFLGEKWMEASKTVHIVLLSAGGVSLAVVLCYLLFRNRYR